MTTTHVDRGGTFTDVVQIEPDGQVRVAKWPSDTAVVGRLAKGALTFGTTVATNALLEGRRVRTLLITTEGLEDLPWIRDMTRPQLFDPDAVWPAPLVDRVVVAPGRLSAEGEVREPLGAVDWPEGDFEAVAVVLLHGPTRPAWELEVAEAAVTRWPHAHIVCGHTVSPAVGFLARLETTLVEASITPLLRRAILADEIPADAQAIRSDGSLCAASSLQASDAVLSGPAGGVIAVAAIARALALEAAVGFDMGGTSTDVSLVIDGQLPRQVGHVRVAGTHLSRPILEVHTIAAGGGSVVHSDGLQLRVGPDSAGAAPGPQCYGRGGPPTVTDAALADGRIDAGAFTPPLHPAHVQLPDTPAACLAVAHEQMAQAIRDLGAQRGEDVRAAHLVAFGGAAGQHAADVAQRCGIRTVWVHPYASVLSAFGQALARREEELVEALWVPLHEGWEALCASWERLEASLPELGDVSRRVDLRHPGTDGLIEVSGDSVAALELAFRSAHQRQYGFRRDGPIEVVNARVRVRAPEPPLPTVADDPWRIGERIIEGPARLDAPTTSVWIPAGWTGRTDRGLLRLDATQRAPDLTSTFRTPVDAALWSARITGVARHAGHVLQRLARSVNVRERLDFSCAVFDSQGQLVANAPHVPVHLGAMGATVRDLIARTDVLTVGQQWVCNDPAAGGSHLPDLTVVRVVDLGGHRAFVANRAHHVDVGGLTPGSMPPHSRTLDDEGLVLRHLPLLHTDGTLRDLREALANCRQPETVAADLGAQMAANEAAAQRLCALGPANVLLAWFAHLQDVAAESILPVLACFGPTPRAATDTLAGMPLAVTLRAHADRLHIDFTGTGGPHPGNLNAPSAVVRAAILYALRVVAGADLPLNDGLLRHVQLHIPPGCILDAPAGAAVAGGNVETSQRIVDLLLRAFGHSAASAGTMSNLTLGGDGWAFYETIGGGQGASPRGPGASARQVHMTNTRAGDPEVLERRLPLAVRRMSRRLGSGGQGTHSGGDGIVRELELLAPGSAALLATRRDSGAPGILSDEGRAGTDDVRVDGTWRPWSGAPIALSAGDRVRIQTPGGGGWSA